ncbi:Piso0_004140 [Millerozyma farinosa CBS 7064]|uniref:Piso0_004140 protein n=1 Tax=Pichia sorbitophila (strain ATCC MYA-4447 / BCRC 22081 / CBS 7064 / NBRC 10061 / NRRL Y-12695) TaxID=559304 RepID=G8YAH7_PICSO|nr:Piso0_004140 [Millerozyma farinosa CBS 7064]CCE84591.1 Piso0_004140 [Millerozyma farinosa CBS 7064]
MTDAKNGTNRRTPLIINAFDMGCSGLQAPGLWKHPKDQSPQFKTLDYWVNLAKLLEKGKFNSLFLADVLGPYDVYNGPRNISAAAASGAQWPINEPSYTIPLMAAVTKNLSFGVTFSTISEAPYHLSRRLATLDHLTNGRVGWNVVSSYLDSAARNLLDGQDLPPHDERYDRAEEYIQVVYQLLLSSWRDDAVKLDREKGMYSDPDLIRQINFEGKFFKVPGPGINDPTPQRLPVILQAGTSSKGKEFAAKNAEVVFITTFTPESLKEKIADIKKIAKEKFGREDDAIKFVQLVTTVIGDTHEEAEDKYKDLKSYGDLEGAQALFSGWTGIDIGQFNYDDELRDVGSNAVKGFVDNWTKTSPGDPPELKKTREHVARQITVGGLGPVFYGTKEEVADTIEKWVDISGVDGFNFTYAITPGTFEEIVEKLIPELQDRGLVWKDYPRDALTFRENVFGSESEDPTFVRPSHPAYNLRWRSDLSAKEFEEHLRKNTL